MSEEGSSSNDHPTDLFGEGNSNPLQYSCLENPMDGRAWWATSPRGRKELDTTERLHFTSLICYKQCLDHMIIKADCCLCMKNCILICYRWLCQLPTTSH